MYIGERVRDYQNQGYLNTIAKSQEDFVSYSKMINVTNILVKGEEKIWRYEIRFFDSYKFLNYKLEDLAKNLPPERKHNVRKWIVDEFGKFYEKAFNLMQRKGIYPYEYMNSWERMDETELFPQEAFESSLSLSEITDEEYEQAIEVWKYFGCKTMKDYTLLYLRTDVLQLSDIFAEFRALSIVQKGLDPLYYYILPGFSWDAMLKMAKVKLVIS